MRMLDSENSLVYLKQWYTLMRNLVYLVVHDSEKDI